MVYTNLAGQEVFYNHQELVNAAAVNRDLNHLGSQSKTPLGRI